MTIPDISPSFTMTQEESDAVAMFTYRNFYTGKDADFLSKVMEFQGRHFSLKGFPMTGEGAASADVYALQEKCFLSGDFREIDKTLPECRKTIEKMFERAKSDLQT